MEKQEIWEGRVRAWQASGKSLAEFSRDKEFSPSGLSYWGRRMGVRRPVPSTSRGPETVRLARVVVREDGADTQTVSRLPAPKEASLVIEAGCLRVHVPVDIEMLRLQDVLTAVCSASKMEQE